MLRKIVLFSTIIFLLGCHSYAEVNNTYFSQISNGVVRLDAIIKQTTKDNGEIERTFSSDGTGFFIHYEKDLYIVTARHIAEGGYDLAARVICQNKKVNKSEVLLLVLPKNRWIFHPNQGDEDTGYVDVAVMKIPILSDYSIGCFKCKSTDLNSLKDNQLSLEDPQPPNDILVFGFPLDLGFKLLEQRPFARKGIVALVASDKFLKLDNKFVEEKTRIIDCKIFKGNSGSPVVSTSKMELQGLIIGIIGKMDFAMIEPVSRIKETLQIAKDQKLDDLKYWFGGLKMKEEGNGSN
jgi:hypothetical protein